MLTELDRSILYTILDSAAPKTNREISLQCGVTVNTVRKEITLINEELEDHGFHILSKAAVGNSIEIFDEIKADPYIARIRELFRRSRRMDLSFSMQVYYLTRRCLCDSGNLTVESLCRELYCSSSTILKDLNAVREILAGFHLALRNRKGGYGLTVEGKEWDIRQCLIFQHKIYRNTIEWETQERSEPHFRNLFFMDGAADLYSYDEAREDLMAYLSGQDDFVLPVVHYPKIIHSMQLCMSRRKYTGQIRFTEEQARRAFGTPEYAAAEALFQKMEDRLHRKAAQNDILGLAMFLLSYDTPTGELSRLPEYPDLAEEAESLCAFLQEKWGMDESLFDEEIRRDLIGSLYRLKNRLSFGVYTDEEILGYVGHQGLHSLDMCADFGRFYETKHGVTLSRTEAMSLYYVFHRLWKKEPYRYYALNTLVISQYGTQVAEILAANLRMSYARELRRVTPCELCEHLDEKGAYDLIITDLDSDRKKYLEIYGVPVLTTEYYFNQPRSAQLDAYLIELQRREEKALLQKDCFLRTNLGTKDGVFHYLADLFHTEGGVPPETLEQDLKETDRFIDTERKNGLVLIPLYDGTAGRPQIAVLLNRSSIWWNRGRAQIFVAYSYTANNRENEVLEGVLRHFVYLSAHEADLLLAAREDPVKILYGGNQKD